MGVNRLGLDDRLHGRHQNPGFPKQKIAKKSQKNWLKSAEIQKILANCVRNGNGNESACSAQVQSLHCPPVKKIQRTEEHPAPYPSNLSSSLNFRGCRESRNLCAPLSAHRRGVGALQKFQLPSIKSALGCTHTPPGSSGYNVSQATAMYTGCGDSCAAWIQEVPPSSPISALRWNVPGSSPTQHSWIAVTLSLPGVHPGILSTILLELKSNSALLLRLQIPLIGLQIQIYPQPGVIE